MVVFFFFLSACRDFETVFHDYIKDLQQLQKKDRAGLREGVRERAEHKKVLKI